MDKKLNNWPQLKFEKTGYLKLAIDKNFRLVYDLVTKFNDAQEDGYDALADQLLTITNEESDHNKAKVKSDNIKWLLSKRKATVYGDKIEVNMNATIDIGAALAEARPEHLRLIRRL